MTETPPFLGVERSFRGNRWEVAAADERTGLALAQRFQLPELVGRLMASRGIEVETLCGIPHRER